MKEASEILKRLKEINMNLEIIDDRTIRITSPDFIVVIEFKDTEKAKKYAKLVLSTYNLFKFLP